MTQTAPEPPNMLKRKVLAWRRKHWLEKCWLGPTFLMLGLMRGLLLILPFRVIAKHLGQHHQALGIVPLADQTAVFRADQIGKTIRTAARYTPWESKCLVQAMVARVLLGLYGIPYGLYLGITRSDSTGMAAHAWVCVGPIAVTGGNSFREFTIVSTFVAHKTFQ
jgi:hypothetical protein